MKTFSPQPRQYLKELTEATAPITNRQTPPNGPSDSSTMQSYLAYQMRAQGIIGEMQLELDRGGLQLEVLSEKYENTVAENETLKSQLAEMTNKITTVQQESITKIGSLTEQINTEKATATSATKSVEDLTKELEALKAELTQLKDENTALKTAKEEAESKLNAQGATKLGLENKTDKTDKTAAAGAAEGSTSEKGEPMADTATMSAEELADRTKKQNREQYLRDLKGEYYERKAKANAYGGQVYHDFMRWRKEHEADIQLVLEQSMIQRAV